MELHIHLNVTEEQFVELINVLNAKDIKNKIYSFTKDDRRIINAAKKPSTSLLVSVRTANFIRRYGIRYCWEIACLTKLKLRQLYGNGYTKGAIEINSILESIGLGLGMTKTIKNLGFSVDENSPDYVREAFQVVDNIQNKDGLSKLLKQNVDDVLDLSCRASGFLRCARIETIAQLVNLDRMDIVKYKGIGNTTAMEIKAALKDVGLSFGMKIGEENK